MPERRCQTHRCYLRRRLSRSALEEPVQARPEARRLGWGALAPTGGQEAHTRARQQTPPLAFPLPCQAVCRRARRAVHAKPSSLSLAAFLAFCSSRAFSYGESSSSAGAAAAAVLRLRLAVLSAPLS
jgi:hypothetical protein